MANLNGFNANEVPPQAPPEVIPEAWYLGAIVESANEKTKDGKGSFLKLKLQITEGPQKGRTLFDRLNLENANETAVNIARATLSAICHATGVMVPKDSVELHNLPLMFKVRCKKREDNGEITNEIAGYKKREAPKTNAGGQTPDKPAATAPWAR